MNDPQAIVAQLRHTCRLDAIRPSPELSNLAEEYAQWCDQANQRLQECEGLLGQGYLLEAIHLSEIEPDLLTLASTLSFGEVDQWYEIAELMNVAIPNRIMENAVAMLNDAYARRNALGDRLVEYRLQALQHAPLRDRLLTLRELSRAEPTNILWQEDLEKLEESRLEQLKQETEKAMREGDVVRLRRLVTEVKSDPWKIPPTGLWVQTAEQHLAKMIGPSVFPHLEQLAQAMNEARNNFNAGQLRHYYQEWRNVVSQPGVIPPATFAQSADAAAQWLEQVELDQVDQANHQQLCARLDQSLRSGNSQEQILADYQQLQAHRFGVPAELHARYRDHFDDIRSRKTTYFVLAAASLIGLGLVGFLILLMSKV